MTSVQSSSTESQSFWVQFAELAWLDRAISFIFRLIAILAEPFLAFGLIASAVDYGSHGHLLESNENLMMAWITTQALALEGSGGVALAMSFESQAQNDPVKAWTQRCLALMLMAVGGVMFFSEMSATAPGFKAVMTSPGYVYVMAGLRTLVSLWYIAVCRTKTHRYSGSEPAQAPAPALQLSDEDVAQKVESEVDKVRTNIQGQLDELRNIIDGQLKEIPAQVYAAAQSMTFEVNPDLLNAQVAQSVEQAMHTLDLSAQIRASVEQAMRTHRGTAQPKTTDELAQSTAQSKETVKIPAITEKGVRIQHYIAEQRGLGKEPTLDDIMAECNCAKNTAVQWRKAMEVHR
ncbi:hypothetical protein KSF_095530 [Reticulibacter mediterranei]|uniref:Uncharacterized protein n=1 Tax=Reticulibacter mediterranei TaxID=2778369 RepID=A0A8J3N8G5_9CHLR|nr:apolipoprotein A1/A4/E family protein [Reticulibacter mediterranei]GHO99505.1 hypothetical protein KSF_095530 [Reticulibacter mediterranei]